MKVLDTIKALPQRHFCTDDDRTLAEVLSPAQDLAPSACERHPAPSTRTCSMGPAGKARLPVSGNVMGFSHSTLSKTNPKP